MRHFIYLDTDTLNSYLSQINGGLLKSTVNEAFDEVLTTKTENLKPGESNFKSEFGIKPLFNLTFAEGKDIINTTNTLSQTESGRELIEKILHDNSLEQFVKYLNDNNLIKDINSCDIGDYVEFKNEFSVRDLDYLLNLFSEEFIEFYVRDITNTAKNEVDKFMQENNLKDSNPKVKMLSKKANDIVNKEIEKYKDIKKVINLSKKLMPFSKYIICNNCVIPLDEKYLRSSTNNIRFTYSGKLNIIGRYTSNLKDAFKREAGIRNDFDTVLNSMDEMLKFLYKDTLGLDESMKIIVPIALYFE